MSTRGLRAKVAAARALHQAPAVIPGLRARPTLPALLAGLVALGSSAALAQELTPPRLLAPPATVWPDGEPPRVAEIVVMLDVGSTGAVSAATIVEGATPRIDAAALEAARALRFEPARQGGEAVAARVRLLVRLLPPPQPPPPSPPPIARPPEPTITPALPLARTDLTPPTGERYETLITARGVRPETSRQTLEREEVTRMPGTMGDPFRVIEVLPGVVPLLTGVPYYYVRGAPPADTGTFVDGVRIPALFHLALGPSVIHPTLVDRIDFFTGGAPARYPGFVGGVVAATSAEIPCDRIHLDADIRLVDSGAMLTVPLRDGHTRLSASGRYSYTGALLTLLQEDVFVDYWDYQLRVEHDVSPRHTMNVMGLGAFDRLGSIERYDGQEHRETAFAQVFHRLDVRSRHRLPGRRSLDLAAGVGLEQSMIGEDGLSGQDVTFGPRVVFATPIGEGVDVRMGADASATLSSFITDPSESDFEVNSTRRLYATGVWTEADVRADERTTVLPGVRASVFSAGGTAFGAVDPRLGVRHELVEGVTLKGSVGLYHQPPAFLIPIPGLGAFDWDRGLQRSIQLSQGVEWQMPWGLSADVQVFYHRYENLSDIVIDDPSEELEYDPETDEIERDDDDVFPRMRGNAYGLEVIVRRPLTSKLFGWVAYTLSRSERVLDGVPTADSCRATRVEHTRAALVPSDADRTHVLNVVASYALPGGFRVGARVHYRSGRPFTRQLCWQLGGDDYRAIYGPRSAERMPDFLRLDLRIDKRWRYRSLDLELYFEVLNVTFSKEVLEMTQMERDDGTVAPPTSSDDAVPLVVPTLGLRAVF